MFARVEPSAAEIARLDALSDAELVLLLKSGQDEALGVLLRRHADALYRFCYHLVANRDDAQDIAQETMTRAMLRAEALHSGSAFRSWLFSIARNLSIDSYRARKRLTPLPEDEDSSPILLYEDSPYDRIEAREEYQTVTEALSKLAKSHQTVLMMREVEGLSYAEIAQRLDVSQSAVETLLFRARRRLREEYARRDAPLPVYGLLGSLRSLLSRMLTPVSGAPLAAKAVVGTVLLGAMVAVPHSIGLLGGAPARSQALVQGVHAQSASAPTSSLPAPTNRTSRVLRSFQRHPGVAHGSATRGARHRVTDSLGPHGARLSSVQPRVKTGSNHRSAPVASGSVPVAHRHRQTVRVGHLGGSAFSPEPRGGGGAAQAHRPNSTLSSGGSPAGPRSPAVRAAGPSTSHSHPGSGHGGLALPGSTPTASHESPGAPVQATVQAASTAVVAAVTSVGGTVSSTTGGVVSGAAGTTSGVVATVGSVVKVVPTAVHAPAPTPRVSVPTPVVTVPTVAVKVPTVGVKVPTVVPTPSIHIP